MEFTPGRSPPQRYGVVPGAGEDLDSHNWSAGRALTRSVPNGHGGNTVDEHGPQVPEAPFGATPAMRGLEPAMPSADQRLQAAAVRTAMVDAQQASSQKKSQDTAALCVVALKKVLIAQQLFDWAQQDLDAALAKLSGLLDELAAVKQAEAKKAAARAAFWSASHELRLAAARVLEHPFAVRVSPFHGSNGGMVSMWATASWELPQWNQIVADMFGNPAELGVAVDKTGWDKTDDLAMTAQVENIKAIAVKLASYVTTQMNQQVIDDSYKQAVPTSFDHFEPPKAGGVPHDPTYIARVGGDYLGPGLKYGKAAGWQHNLPGGLGQNGQTLDVAHSELNGTHAWFKQYLPWMLEETNDYDLTSQQFIDRTAAWNVTRALAMRKILGQIVAGYCKSVVALNQASGKKIMGYGALVATVRDTYGLDQQALLKHDGSTPFAVPWPPAPVSPLHELMLTRNARGNELEEAKGQHAALDCSGLSDLQKKIVQLAAQSAASAELASYGGTQRLKAKSSNLKELYDDLDALYHEAYGHHLPAFDAKMTWEQIAALVLQQAQAPTPDSLAGKLIAAQSAYDAAKAAYAAAVAEHGADSDAAAKAAVVLAAAETALAKAEKSMAENMTKRVNTRSDVVDRRGRVYKRADDVIAHDKVVRESDGAVVTGIDDQGKVVQVVFHPSPEDKAKSAEGAAVADAAIAEANTAGGAVKGVGDALEVYAQQFPALPLAPGVLPQATANTQTASKAAETHTKKDDSSPWLLILAALAATQQ